MKVLSVVGARPQFIKASVVSRALSGRGIEEYLVHTGQHYDTGMSQVFFDELGMAPPACNLEIGSGSHAHQTGEGLRRLEPVCEREAPDAVVIYGDTNATLAGAMVAAKLGIPLAHVEAGLRSFDRRMPEEINRMVADRLSRWLFCPTRTAAENLAAEGMTDGVSVVGDVMYDVALAMGEKARRDSDILARMGLDEGAYVLVTVHRDFNTDAETKLAGIVAGLVAMDRPVIFPMHPRVRGRCEEFGLLPRLEQAEHVQCIPPVGYLDMVRLEMAAGCILTDSGGVQKEAFFHRVPCVTLRPSTEWVETVESGWNRLVGPSETEIRAAVEDARAPTGKTPAFYGDGHAAEKIADGLSAAAAA